MQSNWLRRRLSRRGMLISSIATAGLSASGAALLAGKVADNEAPHSDGGSGRSPEDVSYAAGGHHAHGNMISIGDVNNARNGFDPTALLTDL